MDTNKLKELAERAIPFAPGEWFVENDLNQVRDGEYDFVCDTSEDDPIKAAYIAAANPQAILGLIADLEEARNGMKYQPIMRLKNELDRLKAENEALRQFSAEAYQVFGALDAPDNVLDNASDAANGDQLRHKTLLPFFAESYEALRKDAERYKALRQKERGGVVVRDRSSHLFGENLDAAIDATLEGGGR